MTPTRCTTLDVYVESPRFPVTEPGDPVRPTVVSRFEDGRLCRSYSWPQRDGADMVISVDPAEGGAAIVSAVAAVQRTKGGRR
jgi:hypothetical protein